MEYEIRLTAFLDILGFGKLVETSANNPELAKTIFEVLSSIDKEKVSKEAYAQVNYDKVPPEELEQVLIDHELFAKAMSMEWPITVSYFSDSLVLSATDSNACYIILETIAQLYVRIWDEYGLLLRGGICIDKLIHVDNGPIFGPAMNLAYKLESKEAVNPRVIIEKTAFDRLKQVDLYEKMKHLFDDGEDYVSINLATSYNHLMNHTVSSFFPGIKDKLADSLSKSTVGLELKISEFQSDEKISSKYRWIKKEIDKLIEKKGH